MAAQTRVNPNTGRLEILQEDLSAWVEAMVPLLIDEGYPVALVPEQRQILRTIESQLSALAVIPDRVNAARGDLASVIASLQGLDGLEISNQIGKLANLPDIKSNVISIQGSAQDIKSNLNGLGTRFDLLGNKIDLLDGMLNQALNTHISALLSQIKSLLAYPPQSSVINNLLLAVANQQYTYTLPIGTRRFAVKCRGDSTDSVADVRYAWATGKVAPSTGVGPGTSDYDVLAAGIELEEGNIVLGAESLIYFASNMPNVMMTIRRWS